ncbi:MAG: CPBP family glutamic-type intramembrane protease, partial [Parvibaculum sp.]
MVYRYFALVIVASVPLWIAGYFIDAVPLLPIALPVSALMAFVPAVLALIFVWREGGASAAKHLLARSFDWRRTGNKLWYLPAVLFMPAALAIAYAVQKLIGVELPELRIDLLAIPVFFAMFFAAGLGEEIGWQGYAWDRMKGSALETALIIATVWMVWHIVPYFQTGHDTAWVVWHCMVTILLRVVTVWLYVNGGRSVFIAA